MCWFFADSLERYIFSFFYEDAQQLPELRILFVFSNKWMQFLNIGWIDNIGFFAEHELELFKWEVLLEIDFEYEIDDLRIQSFGLAIDMVIE